jgi:hypothetical protein
MLKSLYYAYVGISSHHPHFAINKANGPVAIAPLTPNLPRLSLMVNVPNWDDDVYLMPRRNDATITSRFTESEPFAMYDVSCLSIHHNQQLPWCHFKSILHLSKPSTQSQCRLHPHYWFDLIRPAAHPRFAKPGPSCLLMVHDLVQQSTKLCWAVTTIPLLDYGAPFLLQILNHPYEQDPF